MTSTLPDPSRTPVGLQRRISTFCRRFSTETTYFQPRNVDELQEILSLARGEGTTVKVIGAAHSFSDIALTDGYIGKRIGYVAMPLDGVWARAPYLHNGSVPSLQDLMTPAEGRSKLFYRGYNVYDPVKVGFISDGPEAERAGFKYDTSVTGNSNEGHAYGTELSLQEKVALIEYLKTQ